MDLAEQVKTNLVHYNLWRDVSIFSNGSLHILKGLPPSKLAEKDDDSVSEWVVPKSMHDSTSSMAEIESWFSYVASIDIRPKRITLAIVNDDGTVVFYFVHDGVTKPRQN